MMNACLLTKLLLMATLAKCAGIARSFITVRRRVAFVLSLGSFFLLMGAFQAARPFSMHYLDQLNEGKFGALQAISASDLGTLESNAYGFATSAAKPLRLDLRIPKRRGVDGKLLLYNYSPRGVLTQVRVHGPGGSAGLVLHQFQDQFKKPVSLDSARETPVLRIVYEATTANQAAVMSLDRLGVDFDGHGRPLLRYLAASLVLLAAAAAGAALVRRPLQVAERFLLPGLAAQMLLEHTQFLGGLGLTTALVALAAGLAAALLAWRFQHAEAAAP